MSCPKCFESTKTCHCLMEYCDKCQYSVTDSEYFSKLATNVECCFGESKIPKLYCTNCHKTKLVYLSCDFCGEMYCKICRNCLSPNGNPVSLQGCIFCKRCVVENKLYNTSAYKWFPMKKWALNQLSSVDEEKLRTKQESEY